MSVLVYVLSRATKQTKKKILYSEKDFSKIHKIINKFINIYEKFNQKVTSTTILLQFIKYDIFQINLAISFE